MVYVRVSVVLIAAGALAGSSIPSAALISLHLPGSGYYRHMGGGMMPMPKPPMPKPPMPKPPMGGGWGGGGHGGAWHAGGWGHGGWGNGGHGGAWHAGGWGHGHMGGCCGGQAGGWGKGGSSGGRGSWHVGKWGGTRWGGNKWGGWGYHPAPGIHPMSPHFYGMGGSSSYGKPGGYAGGVYNRWTSGGGSLYVKFSASSTALISRYGGGNLAEKYGAASWGR